MKKNPCNTGRRSLSFALTFLFVVVVAGGQSAQSLNAQQREIKPSRGGTPEISSVSPKKMLPAKTFDLVITGRNLYDGMRTWLGSCHDMGRNSGYYEVEAASVKAQGDSKAVATFNWPPGHPEAECDLDYAGNQNYGKITVTAHANDPEPLPLVLLAAGRISGMDLLTKTPEAMKRRGKDQFILGPDWLRYVEDGKVLFQHPFSDIQSLDNRGCLMITFKDGKIYTFVDSRETTEGEDPYEVVQAKLKK